MTTKKWGLNLKTGVFVLYEKDKNIHIIVKLIYSSLSSESKTCTLSQVDFLIDFTKTCIYLDEIVFYNIILSFLSQKKKLIY